MFFVACKWLLYRIHGLRTCFLWLLVAFSAKNLGGTFQEASCLRCVQLSRVCTHRNIVMPKHFEQLMANSSYGWKALWIQPQVFQLYKEICFDVARCVHINFAAWYTEHKQWKSSKQLHEATTTDTNITQYLAVFYKSVVAKCYTFVCSHWSVITICK